MESNGAGAAAPKQGLLTEDKREHLRRPVQVRILVAVGKTILPGRTEDISEGGACLRLEHPLPEGARIALRILTPYIERFDHLDVRAEVRYATVTSGTPPCRIGVKFVGADDEFHRRLAVLLNG